MSVAALPARDQTSQRVLVFADDGSPFADRAWLWINAQRWPGWRVEIVTAVDPFGIRPRPLETGTGAHGATRRMTPSFGRRAAFAEAVIEELAHDTVPGDPRAVLLERRDASLIVLGPRTHSALARIRLGSTSQYLLAGPPAPLLLVHRPERVERVIACIDAGEPAQRAVTVLAGMPWLERVDVTLVHARRSPEESDQALEKPLSVLAGIPRGVRVRTPVGPAADTILAEAARIDANLVVLGSRELTVIDRLRERSLVFAVTRRAHASVLAVP